MTFLCEITFFTEYIMETRTRIQFQSREHSKKMGTWSLTVILSCIVVCSHGFRDDYFLRRNPRKLSESGLLQDDMVISMENNVVRSPTLKWSNKTVPYTIDSTQYTAAQLAVIQDGMKEISSKVCIKFVPRTTEKDYIHISSLFGCYSTWGRVGGKQDLSLRVPECVSKGVVLQELLHSLGIRHHWSNYMQIIKTNLKPGSHHKFNKLILSNSESFGLKYEFPSIVNSMETSFFIDGKEPKITKLPGIKIGNQNELSARDIRQLKKLYQC